MTRKRKWLAGGVVVVVLLLFFLLFTDSGRQTISFSAAAW